MSGAKTEGAPAIAISAGRWQAMRPFVAVGAVAITAGGLVAAVTGPTGFARGSWVAAYLVLVAGVAQIGLGAGQAMLAAAAPSTTGRFWQLIGYNGANVAVIAGTLTGLVPLVGAGGVVLFASLIGFLVTVRRAREGGWPLVIYRVLVAILAVSIPVGVVLSLLRLS